MGLRLLIFTIIIASAGNLDAQFAKLKQINSPINSVRDVQCYDLDGDGDLDVLSGSYWDGKIAWYENDGLGNLGKQKVLFARTNGGVESVYAADLDGDGDLDVISAHGVYDNLFWFENDGAGNFGELQSIGTEENHVASVFAADLDGDGDNDLLSASVVDDRIVWRANDGEGNFGEIQVITTETDYAVDVRAADLDGDGDLDVISASTVDDKIAWYENDGFGSFGEQQIISLVADGAHKVHTADLDGDGDLDVLSASLNDDKIAWYENDGFGVFSTEQIITIDSDEAMYVCTSDIDGDGDLDVLSASKLDGKIAWFKNDGLGSFGPEEFILTDSADESLVVWPADLDGDGDSDLLFGTDDGNTNQKIAWIENDGDGNFGEENKFTSDLHFPQSVYAADLDGDSDFDVVVASAADDKVTWYENQGEGNFGSQQIIADDVDAAKKVHCDDLDLDGDLDVIAVSPTSDQIVWFQNDGTGLFGSAILISSDTDWPVSIYSADLDGDGDADILSASEGDDKIAWYENDGTGAFGAQEIITTDAETAVSVFAADLDGDGDLDVLSASFSDDKVAWYENDGAGVFGVQNIISNVDDRVQDASAADLDGDGDMDVFSCSTDDKIFWYENDGTGTFTDAQEVDDIINNAYDVDAADLDGDGDLDLFVAAGTEIAWYSNDGIGNFHEEYDVVNTKVDGTRSVVSVDIDGDGDLDILSASWRDNKIGWCESEFIYEEQISGQLYYDSNENGFFDTLDVGLSLIEVGSSPENDFTYTFDEGKYIMNFTPESGLYLIAPEELEHWSIVSDSLTYSVLVDFTFSSIDSLDFGFYPDSVFSQVAPTITGGLPRCNNIVNYWLDFRNEGTTILNGFAHLQLDDSLVYVSADIIPDSIVGQNVYWNFDSLVFFENRQINVQVQMPTFESIGENLISYYTINALDDLEDVFYSKNDSLFQELICAYDPNDKTAIPSGVDSLGFINSSVKSLDYIIRFQNTGADTAFSIVIKDSLDLNLDWFSLTPISASHPMHVKVEGTGEVIFTFENIMLPDSNVNEIASHGFVRYRINLNEDLPIGTHIYNTARIFFDENPPITTNTKIHTIACMDNAIVSLMGEKENVVCNNEMSFTLIADKNGGEFFGEGVVGNDFNPSKVETGEYIITYERDTEDGCSYSDTAIIVVIDCEKISVFPNPFNDYTLVYFNNDEEIPLTIIIHNLLGQEVYRIENITGESAKIDRGNLKSGTYLLSVLNPNSGEISTVKILIN